MNTRKQGMGWMALGVGLGLLLAATNGYGTTYTWNVINGGTWSTTANWYDNTNSITAAQYPQAAADIANVRDDLPSTWGSTIYNFTVDVPVTIDTLNIQDNVAASAINLVVNQNLNVNTFNSKQDGSQRNQIQIANGVTFTVNTMNFTGDYHVQVSSSGSGTFKWKPISNAALFGYRTYNDGDRLDVNQDFSDTALQVMTFTDNSGSGQPNLEAQNMTWKVGNTAGAQIFVNSNTAKMLQLTNRSNGGLWNFQKIGANDIDMGPRTGANASGGFAIYRGNMDNPVTYRGQLFAGPGNTQAGGNVRIADYRWFQTGDGSGGANIDCQYDTVGANLTIASGGNIAMTDNNFSATYNDVNALWVLPGNTLKAEGTGPSGNITLTDSSATTPGRLGIYFAGATLDARNNLTLGGGGGGATFLNDGGNTSSRINVGGSVSVNSTNPTGGSVLTNSPVGGNAFDDFNLMATTLTMNGGGAPKAFSWTTGAAVGSPGSLVAGNFSQADFTLAALDLTNNTTVNWTLNSILYLNGATPLVIDPGSSLAAYGGPGSMIHIYDPTNAYLGTINTYMGDGRLSGWRLIQTSGVGYTLIPEPASLALLGLGALTLLKRRRKP